MGLCARRFEQIIKNMIISSQISFKRSTVGYALTFCIEPKYIKIT